MKQPEDNQTIDLVDSIKRGRGRPRVENPLTPAERAKRYRENLAKKKAMITDIRDVETVTKTPHIWPPYDQQLNNARAELDQLRGQLEVMTGIADLFIDYRMQKKAMPDDIYRNLVYTYHDIISNSVTLDS